VQYKLAALFPLYFLELQLDALGYFIKSISLDKRRCQPTACYFWGNCYCQLVDKLKM
jgi:hypothetical protein